jgi:hypothetical protein
MLIHARPDLGQYGNHHLVSLFDGISNEPLLLPLQVGDICLLAGGNVGIHDGTLRGVWASSRIQAYSSAQIGFQEATMIARSVDRVKYPFGLPAIDGGLADIEMAGCVAD